MVLFILPLGQVKKTQWVPDVNSTNVYVYVSSGGK